VDYNTNTEPKFGPSCRSGALVKGLELSFPKSVPSNSWKAKKFKFQRMGVL